MKSRRNTPPTEKNKNTSNSRPSPPRSSNPRSTEPRPKPIPSNLGGEIGRGDLVRLNRYISNSGVCARREADRLIIEGKVSVNGKVITELGSKVTMQDEVRVEGKKIQPQMYVYILLNKPRGYLSTTKDEHERKTVLDLIKRPGGERLYPVGRLDRNSSGLLLMTNDGDLTNQMLHPTHHVEKIYAVELDKPLTNADYMSIINKQVVLEDGRVEFDELAMPDAENFARLGIRLHSGRNRIIRRTFEALGYVVEKLDRVSFGMLTKYDLPRGKWRMLSDKEVRILKGQMEGKV